MLWLMSVYNVIAIVLSAAFAAVAAAAVLETLLIMSRTPSLTRIVGSKQALQGEVNGCSLEMSATQCQCRHP